MRILRSLLMAVALVAISAPAFAQQMVNFSLGGFVPRGYDGRIAGDVLVENQDFLLFDTKDFTGPSVGGEYMFPIGEYLEVAGGIHFSSKTVNTIYDRFTTGNGGEIEQQLKLRVVPVSGTVRILPFGRRTVVQPYVGGGIAVHNWRYTEEGDFIDFSNPRVNEIFNARYSESGTAVGPVAVFGLRVPAGPIAVGGEVRYQKASGTLGSDFLGDKIDLSGWHYLFTLGVRF